MLNQRVKRFYVNFWLYHQLDKRARETRDLKKAQNTEARPKKNHHRQGQDTRQLFCKIAEKNEGEIDIVVEKGKNKTNTDQLL